MKVSELINKTISETSEELGGFKKFPRAKYKFTREKAEEFQRVSVETLLDDPYFLNMKWDGVKGLWPKNREIVLDLWEERKKRLINQFVYTSGIGSGKTVVANVILYLQFFEIITLPDIYSYYGLQEGKTIAFIILSKDADAAKRVTFTDLLPTFARSPFIQDYFPPHVEVEKLSNNPSRLPRELRFPRNIVAFPGTGQAASALGYNIRGASLDEANDLQIVESSKKETMKNYYDAAEAASREILERMDSRFPWDSLHKQGKNHGILTMIGQARYPNSFLERKIREAEMLGDKSTIFYFRAPRWEVQPKERFDERTFFFDTHNKRIIEYISVQERPDLRFEKCSICGKLLQNGAYVGNKGKLVCHVVKGTKEDCYKASYEQEIQVEA